MKYISSADMKILRRKKNIVLSHQKYIFPDLSLLHQSDLHFKKHTELEKEFRFMVPT